MKKLITTLAITCFIFTVIFLSCKKVDNNVKPAGNAFIDQAKTWFTNSFVNTAEYKNGTANGNFKTANWRYGAVYKIGSTQIAEFPLISAKKKVYITEQLSESDNRRIIDNTKFKVLFIKAPGKTMEVRIIQFTPTLDYLQNKNFNLSGLSFKDYTRDFKGDFMMFDFDNNFKKGYHFSNTGIKTIKLKTKFPGTNKNNGELNTPGLTEESFCDNGTEADPNCTYIVHVTYEVGCTEQWNAGEGFNPEYCDIQILTIFCELEYCNNGETLESCLNQGNTQEACMCMLYGTCGEEEEDPDDCVNWTETEVSSIINSITSTTAVGTGGTAGAETTPDANGVIRKPVTRKGMSTTLHIFGLYTSRWRTNYEGVVLKTSANAVWKWDTFKLSNVSQYEGAIPACFGSNVSENISTAISGDKLTALASGDYTITITVTCLGGSQAAPPWITSVTGFDNFGATTAANGQ